MNDGQSGCSDLISQLRRSTTELVDEIRRIGKERFDLQRETVKLLQIEMQQLNDVVKKLLSDIKTNNVDSSESSIGCTTATCQNDLL